MIGLNFVVVEKLHVDGGCLECHSYNLRGSFAGYKIRRSLATNFGDEGPACADADARHIAACTRDVTAVLSR